MALGVETLMTDRVQQLLDWTELSGDEALAYLLQFGKWRDKAAANAVLGAIINFLESGQELDPTTRRLLSDALKRVLGNGDAVPFLFGPMGAGRPSLDAESSRNVRVYLTVEMLRQRCGRYDDSPKGAGAYSAAKKSLESAGIFLETDQIKNIRKEVKRRLPKDPALQIAVRGLMHRVLQTARDKGSI